MVASRTWNCTHGAGRDLVGDGDGTDPVIGAEHTSHQEVARSELVTLLLHDPTQLQAGGGEHPVLGTESLDGLGQALQGRPPGQLPHDGALRGGHRHRVADRPTPLGHDHLRRHALVQEHPDRPVDELGSVQHQTVPPTVAGGGRHAAHDDQIGSDSAHGGQQLLGITGEGIGEEHQGPCRSP